MLENWEELLLTPLLKILLKGSFHIVLILANKSQHLFPEYELIEAKHDLAEAPRHRLLVALIVHPSLFFIEAQILYFSNLQVFSDELLNAANC